jgi:hypothetical protein
LAKRKKSRSLRKRGHCERMARGKDLGIGKRRGMSTLPPVVHEHVQGDEHGFEVHVPPPFCEVTGRR